MTVSFVNRTMSDAGKKKSRKSQPEEEGVDQAQEEMIRNVEQLSSAQERLTKINEELENQIRALEHKFQAKKRPAYDARKQAIARIPDFWRTVLNQHPLISTLVAEPEDQDALSYLEDIDCIEDDEGYRVVFSFRENPFFSDAALTKTFRITADGEEETASEIHWKEGKNILQTIAQKNAANSEEAQAGGKHNREVEEHASFFEWWSTSESDLGNVFREDIFPDPLKFFFADQSDDEDDEDDDEDDA